MKTKMTICLVIFVGSIFYAITGNAQSSNLSDCLVANDVGIYTFKSSRANMGVGSGVVGMAGHFSKDHTDNVCTGTYSNINQLRGLPAETIEDQLISVKVEVTKHTGGDSDKWLLHEVEDGYRDDDKLNATIDQGVQMRTINGGNIFSIAIYGAKSYTWFANNNVVVRINCSNCPNTKPEPLEVVQAYLAKFPSIITLTDSDLKSQTHSVQWIKDEMDRRLWLGDKWFMQLQLEKVSQSDTLQAVVKSMNVFLDYRDKYYGIKAADDKNLLAGYLSTNNGTGIKAKLAEYKNWWAVNKTAGISIQ